MENKSVKLSVAMAVAGAITVAGMMAPPLEAAEGVKCYGIARAGKNGCHSANGSHSCAGQAKVNYDGNEWVNVKDASACMNQGGKLKPFNGVNPSKK